MNTEQAKEILQLYRPGRADAADPEVAAALACVEQDAELRRWYEQHCAAQQAIRDGFRQIKPPAALKEQIISERPRLSLPVRRRVVLLAALAVVALLAAVPLWLTRQATPPEDTSFAAYRSRMVGHALRGYAMDLETNELASIRDYLKTQQAPADFALPAGLEHATRTGCALVSWHGQRVAMVCFSSGRTLPLNQTSDVWFFVALRRELPDAPGSTPEIAAVNRATVASWTQGDKVYVLAVDGSADLLKQYL
ncbi:MAG TPA: hypothetical protein VL527_02650 [Dongiaceae bacterium]|nr:hypothetical protein [Dongiaceae bacterium]